MKHIIKGAEPEEFTNWKNQANENWTPTFENLSGTEKRAVFEALQKEQGYICCYCECELKDDHFHIEHHKPQHPKDIQEKIDPLDYSNMLCSCQRNIKKGVLRHCGNSKDQWFDETQFISPLNPDCEKKFKFTLDGHIEPANSKDSAATMTLEKLNLKNDKLNSWRNAAIDPFLEESLSEKELEDYVKGYLVEKESNGGKYNEFFTTIKYLFGKEETQTAM
jgi:uncharacterized protein (TIGR02646 family)